MNVVTKYDFKVKSICLTAYKTLLLLKYLTVTPLSKEQISDLFENDEIISQECSTEMLRGLINTLKQLGCSFSRPTSTNNHKYIIEQNPFSLKFSEKEVELLNKFCANILAQNDWKKFLDINSLLDKICLVINDKKTQEKIKNYKPLANVNTDFVRELQKYCKNKNRVVFEYLSGKKLTEFEMFTSHLRFEKGRLYIWGYSPKYDDYSFIRVDKIKSAKIIDISKSKKSPQELTIRYKIFDIDYVLNEQETLVEETKEYKIIDYIPNNKFYAIQRFLEMGTSCEVISPIEIKEEIISTLKSIIEGYKDE